MPGGYRVELTASAYRELAHLRDPLLKRVMTALQGLANDPRPRGCRKLSGGEPKFRIRVGEYRVVYQVFDVERVVKVYRIRHRSQAYGHS